jgi:hypothetical protein
MSARTLRIGYVALPSSVQNVVIFLDFCKKRKLIFSWRR